MEPTFEYKLVSVLNKSLDPGVAMNALAHMCLGLGASIKKELLRLDLYMDAAENVYPHISQMPFMVLKGSESKIRTLEAASKAHNIHYVTFLDTMTGGSYKEQLERTQKTMPEDLTFYGISLFGPWDKVCALTKKFSLWRL